MSDGQHEHIDYMHNHHHLFSDLENILKMKKDKAFAEKGSICGVGWHVGYEPLEPMTKESWPHMTVLLDRSSLYINGNTYKDLRKFIKALKKGLRRLER